MRNPQSKPQKGQLLIRYFSRQVAINWFLTKHCFSNHFRLPEYRGTFPENQTAQLRGGEKEQVAKAPRTLTYSSVLKAQETHNHFSPAWWALGKVNHVRMTRKWPSQWGQECAFDAWVKNVPLAKGQDSWLLVSSFWLVVFVLIVTQISKGRNCAYLFLWPQVTSRG